MENSKIEKKRQIENQLSLNYLTFGDFSTSDAVFESLWELDADLYNSTIDDLCVEFDNWEHYYQLHEEGYRKWKWSHLNSREALDNFINIEELKIRLTDAANNLDVYVLGHHINDAHVFELINEFFIAHKLDRYARIYFIDRLKECDFYYYEYEDFNENTGEFETYTSKKYRKVVRWQNIYLLIKELL